MALTIRAAASKLGKLKRGCVEKPSEKKRAALMVSGPLARLVRAGRHEEAEAYRWQHYPEKMRLRALRADGGMVKEK